MLSVVETTLWANWFFVGGDYSSYTILRNTTTSPIHATITWRNLAGIIVGSSTASVPPGGLWFRDAKLSAASSSGSVEVAHDGEPQALVGSQTTISPTTGQSFDTVMAQRRTW
jgi:hypothetical protein